MRRYWLAFGCMICSLTPAFLAWSAPANLNSDIARNRAKGLVPAWALAASVCPSGPLLAALRVEGELIEASHMRGVLKLKIPKRSRHQVKKCRSKESAKRCRARLLVKCKAMFGTSCRRVELRYDTWNNYELRYLRGKETFTQQVASQAAASMFLIGMRKRGHKVVMMSLKSSPKTHISGVMHATSQWDTIKVPGIEQVKVLWRPADMSAKAILKAERRLRQLKSAWKLVRFVPSRPNNHISVRFACAAQYPKKQKGRVAR